MSTVRIVLTAFLMISATGAAIGGASAGEGSESVSPIDHELFDKGDGYL